MLDDLEHYVNDGFGQIAGWVNPAIWEVMAVVRNAQRQAGAAENNVAEIGVHHGRFLLGLQALYGPESAALGIDVFENQELNVDKSGNGSREGFVSAVDRFSGAPKMVHALTRDSLTIRQVDIAEIRAEHGQFIAFDVDGGHTASHVYHDFFIAQELTAPGGVILIDDYNNPNWPGVHEGVAKAFFSSAPTFVPLFHGMNKLILTDIGHHKRYLECLAGYFRKRPGEGKNVNLTPRYGWAALTVTLPTQESDFSYLKSTFQEH